MAVSEPSAEIINFNKSHSASLLEKLNAKVRERQLLKQQDGSESQKVLPVITEGSANKDTSQHQPSERKAKKKRKRGSDDCIEVNESQLQEKAPQVVNSTLGSPKKKKKKLSRSEKKQSIIDKENSERSNKLLENSSEDKLTDGKNDKENRALEKPKTKRKVKVKERWGKNDGGKEEFMTIGNVAPDKLVKVHRVLPYWLSHPTVVGQNLKKDGCSIDRMNFLHSTLLHQLKQASITYFFPIQYKLIPEILYQMTLQHSGLRSNDLCVSASTGSGKTLAYVLPVLHHLAPLVSSYARIRALVLLPTQELAQQTLKVFRQYGHTVGVRVGGAIGGMSMKEEQSKLVTPLHDYQLAEGLLAGVMGHTRPGITHKPLVHVVVATPERLKDHIKHTPGFDLGYLKYLIFDEADRLASDEGGHTVSSIVRLVAEHQAVAQGSVLQHAHKLLLSATLSCDPAKLDIFQLHDPKLFTSPTADPALAHDGLTMAARQSLNKSNSMLSSTPEVAAGHGPSLLPGELKQQYVLVQQQEVQPLLLHYLLLKHGWKKVLVFTNTKEAAHSLSLVLQTLGRGHYAVAEFSAVLGSRKAGVANKFNKGNIQVLVCTDSLERGMDFSNVEAVLNYDHAQSLHNYQHRVGRTARAGQQGLALTFLYPNSRRKFLAMLSGGRNQLTELCVDLAELHPLEQLYKDALEQLKLSLESEQHASKRGNQRNQRKVVVGLRRRQKKATGANTATTAEK